ncbi:MAG: PhoU domain-containing protein [Candidatus Aminicenantales bacterium]
MFRKIFATWRREGLLRQALDKTETMFELAAKNYDEATRELIENLDIRRANIYLTDQKINECEKEVRRKVLEHLTVNPKQDLSSSLILITVVKDLERIGDYVKNIVELAYHYPKKLPEDRYASELVGVSNRMSSVLKDSRKVFMNADAEKAKEYYRFYREVTEKTDSLIIHLLEEKKLDIREGVVYALFSRYLKRISAHLANILTTVINPFHLVGYGFEGSGDREVE